MGKANVTLTVQAVTNWSDLDVLSLTEWINAYASLLDEKGEEREEKALYCVTTWQAVGYHFPTLDINQWFRTVLDLIFYELAGLIEKEADKTGSAKLKAKLKKLKASYTPHIEGAYSRFDNCFDEVDFEQERERIIASAVDIVWG